jgi:hypothetical protein
MPVPRLPCGRPLCQREPILELSKLVVFGPASYDFHRPMLVSLELCSQSGVLGAKSVNFRRGINLIGGHTANSITLGETA